MTHTEWEGRVPEGIRCDPVWKLEAYRLGLFMGDLVWPDAAKLMKDRRAMSTADQLYRAVANISSNMCEGFSRALVKTGLVSMSMLWGRQENLATGITRASTC